MLVAVNLSSSAQGLSARPPTVRDVALRAGVSIGTVSRALKNQGGLTEDTRQQVLRAALELGYDTSNLRQTKLKRVSFLIGRTMDMPLPVNAFYGPVLHGVEDACRDEEIVLSYTSLRPSDRVTELVRRHEADGLLCAGYFEPKQLERLSGTGLPIVLIDHHAPGFASVNMDNVAGAYAAVRHLLDQGRRRVAYLGGPAHHSILARHRGFRQALFDSGVPADPALELSCDFSPQSVQRAMGTLLSLEAKPDAIFGFNDLTALEAMRICNERGLRVPEDIAIVGFDDIDTAAHAHPPLSTVRVDKEALGRRGLELLKERDRAPDAAVTLEVTLMVRESSLLVPITARGSTPFS
jgi:DNA-binding LacI/PurR family transcriptional regulator